MGAALIALSGAAFAQDGVSERNAAGSALSAPDLEKWVDERVTRRMREDHVPGAVVCIVKDDGILFAKGYGFADVAAHRAVDADKTLFRIASLTKLFTATAIMQLVQDGRLGLDSDVRGLIDFKLPLSSPQPLTVADLLTHRGGFENGLFGVLSDELTERPPLKEILARTMPTQVRDPGTLSAYSNHGFTLLSYVVERVTGIPYEQYLQSHIFMPLAMQSTSFSQPLPPDLRSRVVTGYSYMDGQFAAHPFEIVLAAGGGAISASATDMGKFMLAHLRAESGKDPLVLTSDTARMMHTVHFSYGSGGGMGYGFPHATYNGYDVLWHTGALYHGFSRVALIPEAGVGIFIAGNSDTAADLQESLFLDFINRYFPRRTPRAETRVALANPGEYAGSYRHSGAPMTTFAALSSLSGMAEVSATTKALWIRRGGSTVEYFPISQDRFRTLDPEASNLGDALFFRTTQGAVAGYAVENRQTSSMERVRTGVRVHAFIVTFLWIEIIALGITLLLLLLGRWRWPARSGAERSARVLIAAASVGLLLVAMLAPRILGIVSNEAAWVPWPITAYLTGSTTVAALALLAVAATLRGMVLGAVDVRMRAAGLLWCGAAIAAVVFMYAWNLIGYHYY
jgi:CubicO group peptidase (beta-lactamase class C family)